MKNLCAATLALTSLCSFVIADPIDVGTGGRELPRKPTGASPESNRTIAARPYIEPSTLHSLGFEWEIVGDANRNGRVAVQYRRVGDANWKVGMDLLRIHHEKVGMNKPKPPEPPTWNHVCGNLYAWSILFLDPGTRYEVHLTMTDPDNDDGTVDQLELLVSTKSEPRKFPGGRRLHVYPTGFKGTRAPPSFPSFDEAYQKTEPGDRVILHEGNYTGSFVLNRKGTREKPIVIQSAGDGPVVFRGNPAGEKVTRTPILDSDEKHWHENVSLFDVGEADFHWFEGLAIRNYDYGIHAAENATTKGLTVRNSRFEDCGWSGILLRSPSCRDVYIADNVFLGTQGTWHRQEQKKWPYKGVWVNGQGIDVCYNRAQNHKDGISVFGKSKDMGLFEKKVSAIDFYNNDVGQSWDDNEADYGQHNIRFFNNRFVDGHVGLSAQPIYGGPCYFIRNVLYNLTRATVFKLNVQPAGVLIYHNLTVNTGDIGSRGVAGITPGYSNSRIHNNLFLGLNGPTLESGFFDPGISRFDYNGYTMVDPIAWVTFDDRYRAQRRTYKTFADLAAATGVEQHAVLVEFSDLQNVPKPPGEAKTHTNLNFGDARLKPTSKAVDAGLVIPNINDGFAGKAPDLGPYEIGAPIPHYGPRETIEEDKPIAIVDSPVSGHVHPSICRTPDGTLVVVYAGPKHDRLMCSRSTDGGMTWEKPGPIATTSRRPDAIREVKRFEVYPGTADTLPDGRVLVTWNYIADDKAKDGYYERALLYTLSKDQGRTWSEQSLVGPVDGKHLGAVRHNVLPWPDGRWLLPLRTGQPRLFDPKTRALEDFPVKGGDGKKHEFQQIIRTSNGTMLAMGPVLLRSTDDGKNWKSVNGFPGIGAARDNLEGRYLTAVNDGRVLVTWGIGNSNKGLKFNSSSDDGKTWSKESVVLLPETPVAARYYSARTIQLDDEHVGTVFMNRKGVHFLKVNLNRLFQ